MLSDFRDCKVFLALGVTDLRKSIDGLSQLVCTQLKQNPLSGHLFVFCNRRRDRLKVLYWDQNGYSLWLKRLEEEQFCWPETKGDIKAITSKEFGWLLSGLDFQKGFSDKSYEYSF